MVIAVKGDRRIKISRSTYEKMFRKKGYLVVEDEAGESTLPGGDAERVVEVPSKNEEKTEETDEDVETIPISEMNARQLKEYAAKHGIDLSEVKNTAQARKIVQREIRKQNM